MVSRITRIALSVVLVICGFAGYSSPLNAAVFSSPTFELDGANPSSLATSGATSWRDLISNGSITGALSGNAAYSSAGDGSLSVSGASTYGGAAFPATSAGTPTNPSGDPALP